MSDEDMLSGKECADLLGIPAASWRSLVTRQDGPAPDGFGRSAAGRARPEWKRSTVEAFIRLRGVRARRAG